MSNHIVHTTEMLRNIRGPQVTLIFTSTHTSSHKVFRWVAVTRVKVQFRLVLTSVTVFRDDRRDHSNAGCFKPGLAFCFIRSKHLQSNSWETNSNRNLWIRQYNKQAHITECESRNWTRQNKACRFHRCINVMVTSGARRFQLAKLWILKAGPSKPEKFLTGLHFILLKKYWVI